MSLDNRLRRLERGQGEDTRNPLERMESGILQSPACADQFLASIAISLKRIADHFDKVDARNERWRRGEF